MPLARIPESFDDPDWLFELKLDGFRALAHIEGHQCRLVSRRCHTFKQWPYLEIELAHAVPCDSAILDGEKCVSMKMPCYLDRPERACNDAERRHSLCDQGKVT